MTKEYRGKYRLKHPSGGPSDPKIVEAVRSRALQGGLPCSTAFEIAEELSVKPLDVGRSADLLDLRICRCQLGLFGYEPEKRIVKPLPSVDDELCKAIRAYLPEDRLPCAAAFNLAEKFKLAKLTVSSTCETLGIRIGSCQLGAF
jgi:hypothetical protein